MDETGVQLEHNPICGGHDRPEAMIQPMTVIVVLFPLVEFCRCFAPFRAKTLPIPKGKNIKSPRELQD